jgi:2-polyprenyl-3-methyl-5-hydroxy-6-metoxy-1,4-benzoquinol methylase
MAEPLIETSRVDPDGAAAPAMERLEFTLPDFTRFMWVSDPAKDVWQSRLERVANAWLEIEWRAVVAGVRSCAVTMASPEQLVAQAPGWAEEGLSALPVEMVGLTGQPYASTSAVAQPGEPFLFRIVIGRPPDVAAFKRAWDAADQEAIGDLLGYPPCCREFFRRVWVDDAMVDTTWPMATATAAAADNDGTVVEVDGPAQANILWRWMGARAVPHLPCRFDCPATVNLGERLVAVGRSCGFAPEMDWLLEVLSWPVEWSALHGIAEIRTPVLKVSTRTDATARRYVVRRRGDSYPVEGAQGLSFPFQAPVKLRLTGTRGFQRGIEHAVAVTAPRPSWYATDNGFDSIVAMEEAHRPIVTAAVAALAGRGGNAVDLGCGNGALLDKIAAAARGVAPFGIDLDEARIEHARALHRNAAAHFIVGDMFDDEGLWSSDKRFALAILMPGRLLEAGPERAAALRARLRTHCDRLLVYAYGDWLAIPGGLSALARQAGLELPKQNADERVALATVVDKVPEAARHGS